MIRLRVALLSVVFCLMGMCLSQERKPCRSCETEIALDTDDNDYETDDVAPDSTCCQCPQGYSQQSTDGESYCGDQDECLIVNGGCEQQCSNFAGTFTCSCQSGYFLEDDGISCVVKSTTTVQPEGEDIDVQLFSTTQRTIYSTIEKAGLALCIVLVILVLTFFAGLAYWLRFHKPTPEDTLELSHSAEEEREIHEVLFDKTDNTFKKKEVKLVTTKKKVSDVAVDLLNSVRKEKCLKPVKVHPANGDKSVKPQGSTKSGKRRNSILKK